MQLCLALAGLGLLAACPEPEPEPEPEPPADSVEYYFGDSTPSGSPWGDDPETYLVRRSLFPTQSLITEELFDPNGFGTYLVLMDIDAQAGTLILEFSDESFTGTGTLTGPPWAWTGWETLSERADGFTVQSTDTLTETALSVDKEFRDPEGNEWTAHEQFDVVTPAEWQELYDELIEPPPGR